MDVGLGFTPSAVSIGIAGGVAEIAVISRDTPTMHLYRLQITGELQESGSITLSDLHQAVVSADLDGDGDAEFCLLSADGLAVSIVRNPSLKRPIQTITLNTTSQRIAVADVDNDKRKDILLFGKARNGVSTLLGRPDGSFKPGPVLFAETSVSDLATADLNGDGITDILALNWLTNELSVFYGISKMIFSEQLSVVLPSEPAELAITNVTKKRTFHAAVTLPFQNIVAVYEGNALGEFEEIASLQFDLPPQGVAFLPINGDPLPDIVTGNSREIFVALGIGLTGFSPPIAYGVALTVGGWTAGDVDGDGNYDVAVLDSETRRLVLLSNAGAKGLTQWPSEYAVGRGPWGLSIRDFNHDGLMDIAVANRGSSTVSILLNEGGGKFSGQYALPVSEGPVHVKAVNSIDHASRALVASHPDGDKISIIRLADDLAASTSISIPTGSNPIVVLAKEDSSGTGLEILVRHRNPRDGSVSLSLFEQLGGGQFLERSIRSNLPNRIIALAVEDITRNGQYDLILATHDQTSRRTTISIAPADGRFQFLGIKPILSYPDSTGSTRSIIPAHVDRDGFKDILLTVGPPTNAFGIVYGNGNGMFKDSVGWLWGMQSRFDESLIVHDADGDGIADIIFIDEARDSVTVLYGSKDGRFSSPSSICFARGVGSIRLASIKLDAAQDLILSHLERGSVSIKFHPFKK